MSEPLDLLFIDLADPLYEGECGMWATGGEMKPR